MATCFLRETTEHFGDCHKWVLSPKANLCPEKLMVSHSFLRELRKLDWKIPRHVSMEKLMAVGSYGVVASGVLNDAQGHKNVCVKRSLNLHSDVLIAKAFWLELVLLKYSRHANVISLIDSSFDVPSNSLTLIMPKADLDLQAALRANFSMRQYFEIFTDLLYGVHYLHSNGIVHRDLAPSNIFLFKENGTYRASIGDLGMACIANSPEQMHQMFTTFPYRAPELFCRQGTTAPAIDIWSAGCILAEILQKKSLFYYPSENFTVQDEWLIFGRQCCALIPPTEMNLFCQQWIQPKGQALFKQIQSRYIQHEGLLWASPDKYEGFENDILRLFLTINPHTRPSIDVLMQQLNMEMPTHTHRIPIDKHKKICVEHKFSFSDVRSLLEFETK